MAIAELRRKADNILLCEFLASDEHSEGWDERRAMHHTIAGNPIQGNASVMTYQYRLGLVFATDDPVNTPDRMDRFVYDVHRKRHFKYIDAKGEDWFVECISGELEKTVRTYGDETEWTIVGDFKVEGYLP